MQSLSDIVAFATRVDAERASLLGAEYGDNPGAAFSTVLGTCLPALAADVHWKREAVRSLEEAGLQVPRRASDIRLRLEHALAGAHDENQRMMFLRRAVWREKARIALRDLLPVEYGGAPVQTTASELSSLAEAILQIVLDEAQRHVRLTRAHPVRRSKLPSELLVVGMGKLGGDELNAGSDIDLVFFYDADDVESGDSAYEYWTRVVQRMVALVDQSTEDGRLWRVDLRLRPEGASGPLVNSMAAAERYYETWGRLWERSAFLRSRPVAGSLGLWETLNREVISPFVYRHEVDPGIATTLAEMLVRSRAELCPDPRRDLKYCAGGIREAEFFVQALQLIWGGREPSLRIPGTLPALQRLRALGLVSDREAQDIGSAYLLLRRVEHRIQWATGLQTHLLPDNEADLSRIARGLHFDSGDELLFVLNHARARVEAGFAGLLPETPRKEPRYVDLFLSLDEGLSLQALCTDHFGDPEVSDHLRALSRRPDGPLGQLTRERLPELPEQILDALSQSANPPQAAVLLRNFFSRFQSPLSYLLSLPKDPLLLRRFVQLLGASEFLGNAVSTNPDIAELIMFGARQMSEPRHILAHELEQVRQSSPPVKDEYERRDDFVTALRRAKLKTMVEVAVADLGGQLLPRQSTRILSDLADEELKAALEFELGTPPKGLSVLAVGKLGGRDIGYASDLDVLFIFDPKGAPPNLDPIDYFIRKAQRIIRLVSHPDPSGPGYELDTRLRPSGSQGLLVTSLESFARYHGVELTPDDDQERPSVLSSGADWERFALVRARVVAGDLQLGERVLRVAEAAAYDLGPPAVQEIHRLRERMELELGRETEFRFDFKVGKGALLDVEFAAQWLQMLHGRDLRVRTPDTHSALRRLRDGGYLARHLYEALREGYRFLRFLEQRAHVNNAQSVSVLDTRERHKLAQLARRMEIHPSPGSTGAEELVSRYRAVTRSVREAYLAVLGLV